MRLLLLGGTRFLGRVVAEAALATGHEVTLFNRGTTNPGLFPEAEQLRGDRDGGLDALRGRGWDAVVDTCGYVPRIVAQSATLLAEAVSHYVFVSSLSVYASHARPVTEASPVLELAEPGSEDVQAHYGELKALCEEAVEASFPGRATHVRAGLIVGPHDPTGRFTYWPHRCARGGDLLVPGPPARPLSVVDVRDLGAWIVRCAEHGTAGTFNAVSPAFPTSALLDACAATGALFRPVYVDDGFLAAHDVGEWMELPLWIDGRNDEHRFFFEADVSRALAAGLTLRPLADTVRATLDHAVTVDGVGLAPEREAALLAAAGS
jgi:2'-hydroxyisoflavone reductase